MKITVEFESWTELVAFRLAEKPLPDMVSPRFKRMVKAIMPPPSKDPKVAPRRLSIREIYRQIREKEMMVEAAKSLGIPYQSMYWQVKRFKKIRRKAMLKSWETRKKGDGQ